MNYRHSFHAGNFADVLKHAVLTRILVHLREKEQAFRVIDTHAGEGLYDLAADDASRTGEWRDGIGRLMTASFSPDAEKVFAPYFEAIARFNTPDNFHFYPGSPLIALSLMRPKDKLIACELHPQAAAELAGNIQKDKRAKAIEIDGWLALNAYVPPPERRGLVLIDPPYEQRDEFDRLTNAVIAAHAKWATGIYVLWYPIKDRALPDKLALAFKKSGIRKILRAEIDFQDNFGPGRLNGTGLIIINPPWRFAGELELLLSNIAQICGPGAPGRYHLTWLAQEK